MADATRHTPDPRAEQRGPAGSTPPYETSGPRYGRGRTPEAAPQHGPGSRTARMMGGEKAKDFQGTLRNLLS